MRCEVNLFVLFDIRTLFIWIKYEGFGKITQKGRKHMNQESNLEIVQRLREKWKNVVEYVERKIWIGKQNKRAAYIFYLQGAANPDQISHFIVEPLLKIKEAFDDQQTIKEIVSQYITLTNTTEIFSSEEAIGMMVNGETILVIEGCSSVLSFNTNNFAHRAIGTSESERSLRGPFEGFVEDIQTNLSILRRKIRTNRMKTVSFTIGEHTRTRVIMLYMEGTVDIKVLNLVQDKLSHLKLEKVQSSVDIIEGISGNESAYMPILEVRERPDEITNGILDGKVAILVDGVPFVLMGPTTFPSMLHAPDDYYYRAAISFVRILRWFAFVFSITLPGIYVALLTFHQELIPNALLINLVGQAQGVPFPLTIEIALLIFFMQMIIDAAFRLPNGLVFILSMLGAFLVGDVAVQVGLITSTSLIVIGLTFISNFSLPEQALYPPVRGMRLAFLFASGILGFYGVLLVGIAFLNYLNSLQSFGVPYMSPLAPFHLKDQKDNILRTMILSKENTFHQYTHEDVRKDKKGD